MDDLKSIHAYFSIKSKKNVSPYLDEGGMIYSFAYVSKSIHAKNVLIVPKK